MYYVFSITRSPRILLPSHKWLYTFFMDTAGQEISAYVCRFIQNSVVASASQRDSQALDYVAEMSLCMRIRYMQGHTTYWLNRVLGGRDLKTFLQF